MEGAKWMEIRNDHAKGLSYTEIGRKYNLDPRTAKKYALSENRPVYHLTEPKPSKLDAYKQQIDLWLEEAPYSASRILEKLQEQGFEGKYSIVKEYVRGKKKDLDEKATVRFETMPGLQGQVDWAFFDDHVVFEGGEWKKLYLLPHDLGLFPDAVHRVCHRHEHQYADPLPHQRIPVFRRVPRRNPLRQHETGGHQAAAPAG